MPFVVRGEHYSSERKIKNRVQTFDDALKIQKKLKKMGFDEIVISRSNPKKPKLSNKSTLAEHGIYKQSYSNEDKVRLNNNKIKELRTKFKNGEITEQYFTARTKELLRANETLDNKIKGITGTYKPKSPKNKHGFHKKSKIVYPHIKPVKIEDEGNPMKKRKNPADKRKHGSFYLVMAGVTLFLMYQKSRNISSPITPHLQALSTAAGVATALEWLRIL